MMPSSSKAPLLHTYAHVQLHQLGLSKCRFQLLPERVCENKMRCQSVGPPPPGKMRRLLIAAGEAHPSLAEQPPPPLPHSARPPLHHLECQRSPPPRRLARGKAKVRVHFGTSATYLHSRPVSAGLFITRALLCPLPSRPPGAATLRCTKTNNVIRFEVSYYFCVLYRGQEYTQYSSDRLKKPQTEAKTHRSAQLSLTTGGGGGGV